MAAKFRTALVFKLSLGQVLIAITYALIPWNIFFLFTIKSAKNNAVGTLEKLDL